MECKVIRFCLLHRITIVVIETLWNVKSVADREQGTRDRL